MNKVQVGATPSPNLKAVRSKIGSLQNATHKPGGGNVKIESRKVDVKAAPRIAARNDQYVPGGGDKKVSSCVCARVNEVEPESEILSQPQQQHYLDRILLTNSPNYEIGHCLCLFLN